VCHITRWEEDYKGNNTSPSLQSPLANSSSPSCTWSVVITQPRCYLCTRGSHWPARVHTVSQHLPASLSSWNTWCNWFILHCSVNCPQITSWYPQGMRVLRQCKVPRAKVMSVTIQRENIRPSKKEMNKSVTMLPSCPMFSVRLWITTSPYRWPVVNLPSTCMLCTKDLAHRRVQLVICGQYKRYELESAFCNSPQTSVGT
jgi:hypothetical protein